MATLSPAIHRSTPTYNSRRRANPFTLPPFHPSDSTNPRKRLCLLVRSVTVRRQAVFIMAGAFQHYRLSSLGRDLTDTLDELISNDMFDSDYNDMVLEHYEKAIMDALGTQVKTKATIRGAIKHYRNHDDIWTFYLKEIDVKIDGKHVKSDQKTEMMAVSKRP
ncbi:unnamed protein product [Agarophyton chilense]